MTRLMTLPGKVNNSTRKNCLDDKKPAAQQVFFGQGWPYATEHKDVRE